MATATITMTQETQLTLDETQLDTDRGRSRRDGVKVRSFGFGDFEVSKFEDPLRQTADPPPRRLPPIVRNAMLLDQDIGTTGTSMGQSTVESGNFRQMVLSIFIFVLALTALLTIVAIAVVKSKESTTERTTTKATTTTTTVPTTTKTTTEPTNTTTAVPTTTATTTLTSNSPGVAFGSPLYTLEIDTTASIAFHVNNLPGWTIITLTREDTTVLNVTANGLQESLSHVSYNVTTEEDGGNVDHVEVTFSTVQCADGGIEYVVNVADEAYGTSVTNTTVVQVQSSPEDPILTLPLQLVVNSPTPSMYAAGNNAHLICTGELGYPNGNTLAVETNVNGNWEPLDVGGTEDASVNNSECSRVQELTKHSLVFGPQYNNTEVRCVVKDDTGQFTTPLRTSPSMPVLLMPETLCSGVTDERFPHPYVCTAHLWCANEILYTYSCGVICPVFNNGTFTNCGACPPDCVP